MQKPELYWRSGNVAIYCGDCRFMQYNKKDIAFLLTDPPYGINTKTERVSGWHSNSLLCYGTPRNYPKIQGDDESFDPVHLLGYKKGVIFGANHFADKLPISKGWIVWDKTGAGLNITDHSDCELAWTNFLTTCRIYNHLWKGMLKLTERHLHRQHPTQKPVLLMKWILEQYFNRQECKLVLDPYMGSGTTLIAAMLLGLPVIGIEISSEYCEVAKNRIIAVLDGNDPIGRLYNMSLPEGYLPSYAKTI